MRSVTHCSSSLSESNPLPLHKKRVEMQLQVVNEEGSHKVIREGELLQGHQS